MMKADRGFALAAVLQQGDALTYAGPMMKADREVVLAAVSQTADALSVAGSKLRVDKEVIGAAMRQCFVGYEPNSARRGFFHLEYGSGRIKLLRVMSFPWLQANPD